jgi:hypothetical protein
MIELFQQWLESRLSVPGIIACGVVEDSAGGICRSADPNFPPERMGEIIRLMQDAAPLPAVPSSEVRWHTWVFTNGKIRLVIRPDGWVLGVAVRVNSDAALILEPLTEEFLTLKAEVPPSVNAEPEPEPVIPEVAEPDTAFASR